MELIRDELCEQIVSAAERLAQGKDPGKLTVRDILKEMGLKETIRCEQLNMDQWTEFVNTLKNII